ncbi:MAG: mycofactocin-associated electron transfer flavoprotein alpha subunit [Acidimicrobiia bacterium]|nr:mycofactocin-associated electron transfer flavoprotein alpha subunit [Acidimicrobiia bacterium]
MSDERHRPSRAMALLPVRSGTLPVGAVEVAAEAPSACWVVGDGTDAAVADLAGLADRIVMIELPRFDPARMATALAPELPADEHVVLPHTPDGRDLAPHLAAALGRPLVSAATEIGDRRAVVVRRGGLTMETLALSQPVVATFQPGVRNVPPCDPHRSPIVTRLSLELRRSGPRGTDRDSAEVGRVELIETVPADPATMDLSEAPRIIACGAGLGAPEHVELVHEISAALGASVGATRVVTDWGWLSADRQIGTTGVTVDPELYIAIGVSGAIQHTAGLGAPDHVVAVNTDPSCPMMDLADLAIVCDGPAFVSELLATLRTLSRTPATP